MLNRLALLLLVVGSAPQVSAPAPPNILFVVVDDASWEEYTNLKMPTIQYGSAVGRVYDHFYTSPVCSPTRAQFHFGRYPHDNLIGKAIDYTTGTGIPVSEISLANVLKQEGYSTGMFGKWHLNGEALPMFVGEGPRLHGYDTWRAGSVNNVMNTGGSHYNWERWDDGVMLVENSYTTHAIGDAVMDWWGKTSGPKFGVCSFLAPHEPFDLAPLELVGGQTFPPSKRGRYESAMVAIDTKILEIAQVLDFSNTYIFLFSDNGTPQQVSPPFGVEKGYKTTPWEGGINVPLIVWGPGVAPGCESGLVQAVDLPATVLDIVGADIPIEMGSDSISFLQTLDASGPSKRHWVWSQRFGPNGGPDPRGLILDEWAILRDDGWKLVQVNIWGPFGASKIELYDIFADPHETTPIVNPVIRAELLTLRGKVLGPDWPY